MRKLIKNKIVPSFAILMLLVMLGVGACNKTEKKDAAIKNTINEAVKVYDKQKLNDKSSDSSASLQAKNKLKRYNASFLEVFDTITQIVGYAGTEEEFSEYAKLAKEKLEHYHKLYDIYNDYEGINNIKTINDNAGKLAVKVDKEIIDLIKFSRDLYEATDGKVNIAMGSVLKLWHDKRIEGIQNPNTASLPNMKDLQEAAKYTDFSKVEIDEENGTVFIKDPNMRLDVGSTAKGYATEQTALYLKERGINHLMLSVGGNIRAIGSKFDEDGKEIPWAVGIQNPDQESDEKSVEVLNITDGSLVTSGVYERYFTVDGIKYHHIIKPDTLMPGFEYLSVSIVMNDSGVADALSTALFNMNLEEGKKFIENMPEAEAMWILPDMTKIYSSGFEALRKR